MRYIFQTAALAASLLLASACGTQQAPNGRPYGYCLVNWSATIYIDQSIDLPCPRIFMLSEPIVDPALITIMFDGEKLLEYSCAGPDQIVACQGPDDLSCPAGDCVKTWEYLPPANPPEPGALGGYVSLASQADPCPDTAEQPFERRIDIIYATPCGN